LKSITALCLLALLASACKPKPDPTCRPGVVTLTCVDAKTAVVCDGALATYGCLGPKGCTGKAGAGVCDDSIGVEGAACRYVKSACTSDRGVMLKCVDGKFMKEDACRGPEGCVPMGGAGARCDMRFAVAGDRCSVNGAVVCSLDKKDQLLCKNGAFVVRRACRGAKGCSLGACRA
jgi:hypothetical protein